MARPTSRTETVEAAPMRRLFGSAANAYKNLAIVGEVSYPVFVRAWRGELVDRATKTAVERGWARFRSAMASAPSGDSGASLSALPVQPGRDSRP